MKIKALKSVLKDMALKLRENKVFYKDCQRGSKKYEDYYKWCREQGNLSSDIYRHMHIAYCLLRGRKYEQIENKVKDGNEPTWSRIESCMREYREVEEIQCAEVVSV